MEPDRIYLDHAATTPVDLGVADAMLRMLTEEFGNPSSLHGTGQIVRRKVDAARDSIADAAGCDAAEVYFTSGGTEANNTALIGALLAARERTGRDHLVLSAVEHHSVLDTATFARSALGMSVTVVPVDGFGVIDLNALSDAVTDRTAVVSVMHANNEIGTWQPIAQATRIAHERGALIHSDSVQAFAERPLRFHDSGLDLATVSAHKIYGPKGTGALIARQGALWIPWLHGGTQERGRRAGTENTAGIVGFGLAASGLAQWRDDAAIRISALRDRFVRDVLAAVPVAVLNGPSGAGRLANNANISFGRHGAALIAMVLDMKGVAVSTGSACMSGAVEPSHVLQAIGADADRVRSAVRFSLGRGTEQQQLEHVVDAVISATATGDRV